MTNETADTNAMGWVAGMAESTIGVRDTVLVCATEPLRSALAELVRARGYEPRTSLTPLHAIKTLVDAGDRIAHALISSDLPQKWGHGLDEFLADEYPDVQRIMLTA